ncbi:MAG: uL30 family ribosomal protein [Nanoarchaeota archaeon]|nr:uL30 family ribosomal protein [Nanoarchaeota archaeon]
MNAIIRVRGRIGIKKQVKDTFQMLRLDKSQSCTLLPESPIYNGMIEKVKDYAMYGPISEAVLKELLLKRVVRKDKKPVDAKLVDKIISTLKSGKLLKDVSEIVPVLRLHPPVKGLRKGGIKNTVKQGGDLGFHESMDDLIKRMM